MNTPKHLSNRLLRLFAVPDLRTVFSIKKEKTKEDVIGKILATKTAAEIETCLWENFGLLRQHVVVLKHNNGNFLNPPLPLITFESAHKVKAAANCLTIDHFIRQEYELVNFDGGQVSRSKLLFDWPIRIEIRNGLLVIKMSIVHTRHFPEATPTTVFENVTIFSEQQVVHSVKARFPLIIGLVNISKGIKGMSNSGVLNPERLSLLCATGTVAHYECETGDIFKTSDPAKFQEFQSETLLAGGFKVTRVNNTSVRGFLTQPKDGELKFFVFPLSVTGVDEIISDILANN